MPDPSPDWSFTFTDHPDGTSTSSARPPRELDATDHALVRQLRAEAELLETLHDCTADHGGSTAAPDGSALVAHVDRIVELTRLLQRKGLTVDEVASHADLSLIALGRWLDARP
ncbi:hypothetical protein [Serinibacter arcticus]|uniref:Uncharacterized protein n=1 Tax=Serinibacter arcticus TaxID=1655435 RepID=A0A4Z1DY82_9MICO|nr:hypothetical protein [Serinibacter arcticus]TGO04665.1 hypothetical protein SERN_2258 [Serinibacter arcticus]